MGVNNDKAGLIVYGIKHFAFECVYYWLNYIDLLTTLVDFPFGRASNTSE